MEAIIAPASHVNDVSVAPLAQQIQKACQSLGVTVERACVPGETTPVLKFCHPDRAAIDEAIKLAHKFFLQGSPWRGREIKYRTDS